MNFVQYPTKDQVHFVVQLYNLDYLDHLKLKILANRKFYRKFLLLMSSGEKPTKDGRFRARLMEEET